MKDLAVLLVGTLAISLAAASSPTSAGDYNGGSTVSSGYSSSSGYGGSNNCYKCPPQRNYDTREVQKETRDIDRSRVVNTETVVPSKRVIETNALIIHENETRNVGTIQHNHTIIEKELILRKNNVDNKYVNTTVNLVQNRYHTERKHIVEEREIPGEVRDLRDCNCGAHSNAPLRSYGMATGHYGSPSRHVNSRY